MQIYIVEKNVRKILFSTMKNRHFLDLFFVLQKKSEVLKPNEKGFDDHSSW